MNRKLISIATLVLFSAITMSAFSAEQPKPADNPKAFAQAEEHVYAVIVGADYCTACKSMHDDIRKLRAEGYEIYYEEFGSKWCKANGIVRCPIPAIVIMRGAVRLSLKIGAMPLKALLGHFTVYRVWKRP